jgi:hypothetical protein
VLILSNLLIIALFSVFSVAILLFDFALLLILAARNTRYSSRKLLRAAIAETSQQ